MCRTQELSRVTRDSAFFLKEANFPREIASLIPVTPLITSLTSGILLMEDLKGELNPFFRQDQDPFTERELGSGAFDHPLLSDSLQYFHGKLHRQSRIWALQARLCQSSMVKYVLNVVKMHWFTMLQLLGRWHSMGGRAG